MIEEPPTEYEERKADDEARRTEHQEGEERDEGDRCAAAQVGTPEEEHPADDGQDQGGLRV